MMMVINEYDDDDNNDDDDDDADNNDFELYSSDTVFSILHRLFLTNTTDNQQRGYPLLHSLHHWVLQGNTS